jgi:hypothetical protein
MAFSLGALLAIGLEILRPMLPLLIALVAVDIALLAWLLARPGQWRVRAAARLAVLAGGGAFLAAVLGLPPLTGAGFSNLHGLLDFAALTGMALAMAVAVALMSYPPLQVLLRARPAAGAAAGVKRTRRRVAHS